MTKTPNIPSPNTAMIFAAGIGTRMLPLTKHTPKAMVEVCGKPLIDWRIEKLIEVGVQRIVVNTHYLAPIIEAHLAKRNDVEIIICHEKTLLETGGGLVNALPHLGSQPFYITNCDTIWLDKPNQKPALLRLAEQWANVGNAKITMLLHDKKTAFGYDGKGDFNLDQNNLISWPDKGRRYVYTGVQICSPQFFENIELKPFSLADLWRKYINNTTHNNNIYGIENAGDWLHIDSVANLHSAENYLKKL